MPALSRARNSPCAYKSAGGGLRGNPRRGFPLFSLRLYVCADTLGGFRYLALPFDPISLVLAQRNGVEPPKKSAFLHRRLHHSRERYKSVDYTFLARLGEGAGGYLSACLRRGRTGLVMAALRGKLSSRVSLSLYGSAYRPSAFLWGSTPFLCARAKKWGGTGSRGRDYFPRERRTRTGAHARTQTKGPSETESPFFALSPGCSARYRACSSGPFA